MYVNTAALQFLISTCNIILYKVCNIILSSIFTKIILE